MKKIRDVIDHITLHHYEAGIETNKRVGAILMRKADFFAKGNHCRKPSYGQSKATESAIKKNLLNRQFSQGTISTFWISDLSINHMKKSTVYTLCFILKGHFQTSSIRM